VTPIPLLVVVSSPEDLEILQRLLPVLSADLQFVPKWVDTAEKAIEEIARENYALVLLDHKLPGADGLTVLAHIRNLPSTRQPSVIMLTDTVDEAAEAMKCGAKDYLPKDRLDAPSLVRAITPVLEGKRLEEQVARYADELREKNAQMEIDLNLAREIQRAFLPHSYPTFPRDAIASESALYFRHRYHPTNAVGGDFFDVLPISDTEAGVLICDIMGHGVRAALMTAIVHALAEELIPVAAEPDKFLTEINRRLLTVLAQTHNPMFTSAFYAVIDLARGELRYSNAGHPNPLLVRRSAAVVETLDCPGSRPGPVLGVFEESMYPLCRRMIERHDLLLLFTDGLYEVEDPDGQAYGRERLLAAVRQRINLPVDPLFEELLKEIQQYAGKDDFIDDVCIVGAEAVRVGAPE
jgi:serine phosphatase RsbU (regulator of sigma subunit)